MTYFPSSRLAFALIRAAWAGDNFPAFSSLVANSSGFDLVAPIFNGILTLPW
jgi:hypothetical protein